MATQPGDDAPQKVPAPNESSEELTTPAPAAERSAEPAAEPTAAEPAAPPAEDDIVIQGEDDGRDVAIVPERIKN